MRLRGQTSGGIRRVRRRLIGTLAAAAALLVLPTSAQANLELTGSHAEPADLQAGAHSDFNIHVQFGSEDVKDLTISLPPGEVGNPLATPQLCDPGQLPNCPANTAVGTVSSSVTIASLLPQTITGTVFNVAPQTGEPARFGIVLNANPIALPPPLNGFLLPPTVVQSGASLRQSDLGLDTVVKDIPNTATLIGGVLPPVPIHINSMDLKLNGTAAGPPPQPFMRNPTSCTDHLVRFAGDSYASSTVVTTDSPAFATTGCENEDFSPSFSAFVGGANASMKTSVTTSIDQDLDEAGLVQARVVIPPDLNPDVQLLGNRCSPADFEAGVCPPNTIMGSAVAASPLLSQPLAGNVVFIETGGTPDIGLDLQGQLHLLLRGSLGLDKVVVFDGLPDIPIAHFALTFPSAPGLLTASRNLCVPPPPLFHADFTGYNGASTAVDSPATVQGACGQNAATKCKKAKKKRHKRRAAEAKKKHKKKSCKKKKRKKKR
jgi:hypothetical protein